MAIDLKKLKAEHPECFEDGDTFKAYLLVGYPDEKRGKINVLTAMLQRGVLAAHGDGKVFRAKLCDDFGFSEGLVGECYALFEEIFYNSESYGLTREAEEAVSPEPQESETISNYPTLDSYDRSEFVIQNTTLVKYKGHGQVVAIPLGVTTIYNDVFKDCEDIKVIVIPESVISIGSDVFRGCSGLESIKIPEGVTKIDSLTFDGCSGLKSIEIPEGVTKIGYGAFSGCSGLESIKIPKRVRAVDGFSGCSGLKSVEIPEGVHTINSYAFSGCSGLKSVNIPESVTAIGNYAFDSCKSLESIIIPRSVSVIGECVFGDCDRLTIFCEAEEKPKDWHKRWLKGCGAKVVWDFKK